MKQLALPLPYPAEADDAAFVISSSNSRAAQSLKRWGAWPVMAALLVGPRKSGRSLLARIFAAHSGGTIIDDAERADETAIFHAWNNAQADRRPLLIVADSPPPAWSITLPDLRSRLAATPVIAIEPPDEKLMHALLERDFARRGLDARPELVQWLLARLERSHVAIVRAVDALDQEVGQTRKRLSIPLARGTLAPAGLIVDRATITGNDAQ
ncbi:chromosomal replication initiator DnaA [Sphingomonas sp. 28-63-12]|uniref:HdaA/DnaA family protein n=1 Tax=Sphingomonas sp. 28-63-12 TaxID=1970434 RepID=UPI000BDC28EB|nr:MAG: chromosomal replication initiator DnaA [Sphingomonas sp. 28-63-12]